MRHTIFTFLFCFTVITVYAQTETDNLSTNVNLDEVVVTAKRPTTKFTDTGLIYDMKADPAVRTMSLLEALRRVPMVTVTADDEIRVKGNGNYAIYLNGRPYRVAQSDPKAVLGSIPANTISKVELITELDGRYDAEAGSAIINIITVKNALDGYTLTLNGRVSAKPEHERVVDATTDGLSVLATKGKVNMMLGYDFTWQNVLNQPMSNAFTFFYPQGGQASCLRYQEPIRESTTTLRKVDGNYNYHTGRLMMEWTPDSLNSLYIDGHALINHFYSNAVSQTTSGLIGVNPHSFFSRSYQSTTSGTAEANLIYRNYYRGIPDLCRFSLGYRFALDPEKAKSDFTTSKDETFTEGERTLRTVNGHLQEHTFNADYTLPIGTSHTLRFGAKYIMRIGKTKPEYFINDNPIASIDTKSNDYDGAMNYTQNITALYTAYSGRLGKFNVSASLRGEFSHNTFTFKESRIPACTNQKQAGSLPSLSYNYLDVIPRLSLIYNYSPMMRYTLTYNTSVARPSIGQLDPFRNINYPDFEDQGNPDLRQSRTHSLNLTMLKMSQKLIMQMSASASHCANPIVDYYYCNPEQGIVTRTAINYSRCNYLNQSIYVGYQPTNWVRLTLAPTFTENWFYDKTLDKRNFGVDWNLYLGADFSFPRLWTIGAQLMCNRQYNDPNTLVKNAMVLPAFYVNKSLMDGRLNLGLTVASPFAKYTHHKTEVNADLFSKRQYNDILSRQISVKLSYRLSGGKKASLDRYTSLRNEDLSTGVN